MPFYGAAILCVDDPGVRSIMPMISRPLVTYGFGADAMVRAVDIEARRRHDALHGAAQERRAHARPAVTLNLPGDHNVLNALAAIAVAAELELRRRAGGQGPGRVQRRRPPLPALRRPAGRGAAAARFTLIDDYGHHPVEMAATLAAARGAFPGRRIVLAFQPHRYTRTRDCFEDFVKVMGSADAVLLAEVYAAGEAPIVAADGRSLARALRVAGKVDPVFVDDIGAMAGRRSSSRRSRATSSSRWAPARSATCRRRWSRLLGRPA